MWTCLGRAEIDIVHGYRHVLLKYHVERPCHCTTLELWMLEVSKVKSHNACIFTVPLMAKDVLHLCYYPLR